MTPSFHLKARRELDEAISYYDAQQSGLGGEFLDEVLGRIAKHPQAWQSLGGGFRRCRTNRFPYGVIYRVEGGSLYILAVAHSHRQPDYWRERTDD